MEDQGKTGREKRQARREARLNENLAKAIEANEIAGMSPGGMAPGAAARGAVG